MISRLRLSFDQWKTDKRQYPDLFKSPTAANKTVPFTPAKPGYTPLRFTDVTTLTPPQPRNVTPVHSPASKPAGNRSIAMANIVPGAGHGAPRKPTVIGSAFQTNLTEREQVNWAARNQQLRHELANAVPLPGADGKAAKEDVDMEEGDSWPMGEDDRDLFDTIDHSLDDPYYPEYESDGEEVPATPSPTSVSNSLLHVISDLCVSRSRACG